MKDSEWYTHPKILGTTGYSNLANHKYVLDTRKQRDHLKQVATADRFDAINTETVGLK